MDAFQLFNYGTAAWLGARAVLNILTPGIVVPALVSEVRAATSLELHLSRCLGFTLAALAVLSLILTGTIPLSSTQTEAPGKSPYAFPVLLISTSYHTIMAFYNYMTWTSTGVSSYAVGMLGSFIMAAVGGWAMMFGGGSHISRRTGADKRTSGFPFKNVESERKKGR